MTWWREKGDFVWIPLLALALVWLDTTRFTIQWAVQVAGGLTLFTFVEYVVHRWVLHGPLWLGRHERHHSHPQEKVIFPWYFTPVALAFPIILLSTVSVASVVGFLMGTIWFFVWHHVLHQWSSLDAFRARKFHIVAAYAAWHDLHQRRK